MQYYTGTNYQDDIEHFYKVIYDGTTAKVNIDGVDIISKTVDLSTVLAQLNCIIIGVLYNLRYFRGSIDLKQFSITVDGVVVFNGSIPLAERFISGITSSDVTTALGYTPYNSSNPNGYTSNVGTVTSVNNTSPDSNGNVSITIPTVNDATLTINQNGSSAGTFTANASSNVTINLTDTTYSAFTGTDGIDDGASGLVPAPETTDDGKYLNANGNWKQIAYSEISGTPTIPTSSDYWTLTTNQTSSGKKMINYSQGSAQDNGFRVIATSDTAPVSTVGAWSARVLIGNEKRTFLLGTARNSATPTQSICGVGAHTWGSATSQTSAQWDNIYFQPDGSTGTYIGGNGWRGSSGWLRVLNNNTGSAAYRTAINTGTATSPSWKTVLPNQATGTGAVQIINSVSSSFSSNYGTSVNGTITSTYGTSIGYNASAGNYGVGLGASAIASGAYSIQLGYGTNSTANTFNVGLSSSLNVQLLNSSGQIPAARLDIASSVDSSSTNSQMVGAKLFYDTVGDIETLLSQV